MNAPAPTAVKRRASPQPDAPTPSIESARAALGQARRLRAEYLVGLAGGFISAADVVIAATTEEGKALRRISLRQLHLSQEGWGERRTNRLLSVLADRLGTRETPQDMTIAWLIDARSGGRRYLAWLDAQQGKHTGPWAGFPFTAHKGEQR